MSLTPPFRDARETAVARTEGYTYPANRWAVYLVQGAFSAPRAKTLIVRFTCTQDAGGCGVRAPAAAAR
jgi:hypothetical protein